MEPKADYSTVLAYEDKILNSFKGFAAKYDLFQHARAQIHVYVFTFYMGGAIFANSEGTMEEFGVGHISAGWACALSLVGYIVGPLLF